MNRIIAVAFKLKNGEIITLDAPKRHHHVIKIIIDTLGKEAIKGSIQGFIDSNNTFLTRAEAYEVALNADQIKESNVKSLISEDLW